jgi:phenylpropionate dioxygenase-like ring-hydroxylating dioxygenase large terminal subunit
MYIKDTNESLTRTGPGTPMSDLMRRFWIPALLERELAEPGAARIELRLFGEDFVAFRDAQGRVKLASYPTLVRAGVVWTYMGPNDFTPQLPDFAWSALPQSRRYARKRIEPCNWAHGVEEAIVGATESIFLPPFYILTSNEGHAWVPVDDAHTCVWSFGANPHRGPVAEDAIADFHRMMIGLARENARGHIPEAASHGERYAAPPFPASP